MKPRGASEHTVNNQRRPVEEQTRNLVRVRVELLTGHETVEDQTRIGQTTGLNGQWGDGTRVCRVSGTQPWESRVVVRAICGTVLVVISHVRERRVRKRVPEIVEEKVGEFNTVLGAGGKTTDELHRNPISD